ncbi:serine hydroxymethyltransferase [Phytohalomonas tamaricis]|uniref:serine hydroxymethyltransferase n=1 Tax=Phytohalomonas tamaricis TaxID=2081032 RepID=UPI000D0B2882|nr:serine hydroxymethyltransferase [Phytohalomonas tamaricis]
MFRHEQKKETTLADTDTALWQAIDEEHRRQERQIALVAAENYASPRVLAVQGSRLTNSYVEGYSGKRITSSHSRCASFDYIEQLAIGRARTLFGACYANVQPYAGVQANAAAYRALLAPGDTVLGMRLDHGGQATHGAKASFSGQFYNAVQFGLDLASGDIDYAEVEQLAREHQPKMIIAGFSAYAGTIDWARFRTIADEVGAWFVADMAHVAGLVAAGVYPSPLPHAHVVTATTHKTLRGPRGAVLLSADDNTELHCRLDAAVYPGSQDSALMNVIAAKALAFKEAMAPEFIAYQRQVIANARAMAKVFDQRGFELVTGGSKHGTDNHLLMVSLIKQQMTGKDADAALARADIVVNRNTVPEDPESPFVTSGLRLGTPGVTTRGLKEEQCEQLAGWVCDILEALPEHGADNVVERNIKCQVDALCRAYPVYS